MTEPGGDLALRALQEREQVLRQSIHFLQFDHAPCAPEGLLEALVVEGLDQIVDRREVERLERVVIVGGHEDRGRHLVEANGARHFDPGLAGHLYVKEYQVRLECLDRGDCGFTVVDLADDLDSFFARQQVL